IQAAFAWRYGGARSLIANRKHREPLAMLTTTSAFGRSSMYSRLRLLGRTMWEPIGVTSGHGEFLFGDSLYSRLREFVAEHAEPRAGQLRGASPGWRNRREVVRTALKLLQLPYSVHVHGIARHIYVAPLGETALNWLRGETAGIRRWNVPAAQL